MSVALIRQATLADLDAIAELGAEIVRLHHNTNPKRFFLPNDIEKGYRFWLGKEFTRKEAVVLVATLDDIIVGYAYGTLEKPDWGVLVDHHGVLQDLYVTQSARLKGVGRKLSLALIEHLEALGAPRVLLYAMVQNEPAQRLFASLGFAPTMVEMTRERTPSVNDLF